MPVLDKLISVEDRIVNIQRWEYTSFTGGYLVDINGSFSQNNLLFHRRSGIFV